ncbi:hypothetical protein [Pseudoalteromonas peptidolytica]|uniref:hypothetical protein n=1 Tax=Pseudoalteromonas peptidolytica TaxID=61150 RepID=UPI00298EC63D|nr:hypothetical protein [Pseudoalteromonas peptidolytica]MDW7551189.1 hypothetical protein [Pseudoalteromonas peptidolytica]
MKKTMMLFAMGFSSLCAAETINTQALKACTLIENDFNRLMCYDNVIANKPISKPQVAKTSAQPTVQKQVESLANTAPTVQSVEEGFGLERRVKAASEDIEEITAKVTEITEKARNRMVFTLDNGQVWKQVKSETFFVDAGDTVIIERASFGSFLMKKAGLNRTTRVKRVN